MVATECLTATGSSGMLLRQVIYCSFYCTQFKDSVAVRSVIKGCSAESASLLDSKGDE